jgi:16S rRNA (guanine966-N2)-methyltransferase
MSNDNRIRIIGGRHRGRKLSFPDAPGLRPTSDRIRETLFNWLQTTLPGARCLDLFAGSGALGLEAASRGAGRVVLVERSRAVAERLLENGRLLGLEDLEVVQAEALRWLAATHQRFDVVFLDPPFADHLLERACTELVVAGRLAPGALVYLESDAAEGLPALPAALELIRHKQAGQVAFGLARLRDASP